jgi:hypothetical protein
MKCSQGSAGRGRGFVLGRWPFGFRRLTRVRCVHRTVTAQLLVLHGSVHVVAGVHFVDDGNRVVARSHRWQGPSYMRVWRAPDELDLGS